MKDRDIDILLGQHLSGDQPREVFKQEMLGDLTAEFVRVRRRRSAWRRAELAAAAVLIAGVAFLGGRLSAPSTLPEGTDVAPQATAESDGVNVPSDLVAWLDAARLFGRLGMQERMARAVEHAGKLMPYEAMAAISAMDQSFTPTGHEVLEDQSKRSILADILRSHESVESVSGIMAQSFGGHYYESKMD
jgi:hypothetical protein